MRSPRLLGIAALTVGIVTSQVAATQPAPPGAPTASPAAPAGSALPPGHPPSGAMSSGALPPGHPPAGALPPGHPPSGAMPPGHPPSGAMPPGHPPSGALPPGHPPSGALPPGHPPSGAMSSGAMPPGHPGAAPGPARRGPGGMFEPPEDEILDVESFAPGTIEVELRDADDAPVAGAPVTLGVLHSTVATGEQRERLTATTDERGIARWEGLKFGMAHTYEVSSVRGPSRFDVQPFNLLEKGGRKVVLHVYDTVTDLDMAQVGVRVLAFFSLREDAIQAEQVLEVFNLGRTAWQAEDVKVKLPAGFRAFTRGEEGGVANVDPEDDGYSLRGTFKPGRTAIGFRWQMPLSNDVDQTIEVGMPPRVAQARVLAEASKSMELSVAGAPAARRTRNRDGRSVLVTERAATQGDRGIQTLSVTLKGLPTKSPARWVALFGGLAMVLFALRSLGRSQRPGELPEDTLEDLVEAREALLAEIVALERARQRGDVGPKTYERVRAAMLDALANIIGELERAGVSSEPSAEDEPASLAEAPADDAPEGAAEAGASATPKRKRKKKRAPAEATPEEGA